jgi:hypothetical protein
MRVRLRPLMLAVAIVGVFMAAWRTVGPVVFYNSGPHQFILKAGQAVIVVGQPEEGIAVWTFRPGGLTALPVGTRCVVVNDPATSTEDRWTDRTIVVRIAEELHRGECVSIMRSRLRAR